MSAVVDAHVVVNECRMLTLTVNLRAVCEYAERKLLLKLQQDAECHNVFFSSLFFCYFFPTFNAYRPHACLLHIEVP